MAAAEAGGDGNSITDKLDREAIERGVDGYVLKQAASTELVSAIEESMRGGRWLSPSLAMKMFDYQQAAGEAGSFVGRRGLDKRLLVR